MDKKKQHNCKCPNTKSENHGNCKEYRGSHGGKSSYCQLSPFSKRINYVIFKLIVIGTFIKIVHCRLKAYV